MWVAQVDRAGKWQTHQTARREACVSPSHAQESIYLMAVSQSFSQVGINLMECITYILIWFS